MSIVSIIVPVYNVEKYLEVCIDSILNQTYKNYELILIDDGSTDGSGAICDRYADSCDKIHVMHQANSGVSVARNVGFEKARGDYVTVIDSDDWIEPDYIERMIKYMTPGGFVASRVIVNDELSVKSGTAKELSIGQMQMSVFSNKGIGGYAVARLFDCKLIREKHIYYGADIAFCEDLLFTMMYLSVATGKLMTLDYAGYHYCTNNAGAILGRYGHKPPRMKDFTEIVALERVESYLIPDKKVRAAWEQRRDKAAAATLRTMVSCDYDDKTEMKRLRKMVRRGCVRYIFGNVGCLSGKLSVFLCAISPQLEWKIYQKRHTN